MKLKHPPVIDSNGNISTNPFIDFDPNNPNHYPEGAGVYIYGVKVEVDNQLKFVPVCVGESLNLRKRLLNDHYHGKFVKNHQNIINGTNKRISEKKELWNFSLTQMTMLQVAHLYCDMRIYSIMRNERNRTSNQFLERLNKLKNLIYFQNENFFNIKHNLIFQPNHSNISASEAAAKYSGSSMMIKETLKNFCENFYFVYADDLELAGHSLLNVEDRLNVEVKLKDFLGDNYCIYTTADSNRKGRGFDVNFDFTAIVNELVQLRK
jgi:hypothetical protein